MSRVNAIISKSALVHNYDFVKSKASCSKVIAMVKADAYGHGLLNVARALPQADAFGVAKIEEAVKLREGGIQNEIFLMQGCYSFEEAQLAEFYGCYFVVHDRFQLELLRKLAKPMRIWLKVNTGMNRLGLDKADLSQALEDISQLKFLKLAGYMSHLARADNPDCDITNQQITCFNECLEGLKGDRSLANSAAVINLPQSHLDWVRPGLMLYGASPNSNETSKNLGLKPVMELQSMIMTIRHVAKGDIVGYGASFKANRNMKIAIVCAGYGDGYPWQDATSTKIIVKGQVCALVGRVSMDMLAIDVSQLESLEVNTPATLWGTDYLIEEAAQSSGTIPWELLCRLTHRVKHRVVA